MGRSVVYTGSRHYVPGRRQKTVKESWYIGTSAFKFVSIAAIAVLLGLYVSNSARNSQNDSLLQSLNQQKSQLNDQLDSLQVEEARNNNALKTQSAAVQMGMVQSTGQQTVSP